jgi:putative heme-binding domain-containing protein
LQSHLGLKNGSLALATALTANPPSADQARLALAWLAQIGRDDTELRLALQKAAGFQTTGAVFSEALVKQLIEQADASGNARRGESLFKAAQSACLSCHKVGELGGVIGPDLSALGRAQTKEAIVESVLWPKRQVKEGYMLTVLTTKDGRTFQGYRSSESTETLTLRDFSANALVAVSKRELAARNDAGTIMPDGLTDRLSPAELADLLRYLFELK